MATQKNKTDKKEYTELEFTDNGFVASKLIEWYESNKRELPWRDINDPYKIWISEIILQQTRVNQGMDYYLRFIDRFPDIHTLADADEQEVLKYWQGLGYYSRARNLHAAAQTVVNDFGGIFPNDYHSIIQLKGIGEYTASAIISFAWNKPYPVVDGNVFRFLSRLLMIDEPIDTNKGKTLFTKIAGELMDVSQAGIFNQAIMEFGALQCVPASPNCFTCPFSEKCFAYSESKTEAYPVKLNKVKIKNRYFHYFYIRINDHIHIRRRTEKDIWQNLYEFPSIETTEPLDFEDLKKSENFRNLFPVSEKIRCKLILKNKKHVLTHRVLWMDLYQVELCEESESLSSYLKIPFSELDNYPVHRLMQFCLEKIVNQ